MPKFERRIKPYNVARHSTIQQPLETSGSDIVSPDRNCPFMLPDIPHRTPQKVARFKWVALQLDHRYTV